MAAPNSLFLPTISRLHAQTAYMEVMEFLSEEMGIIDIVPDSSAGGAYFHIPRWGKISGGFGRVDVTGTLTTSQTSKTFTHNDEIGVVVHDSLLMEYFSSTNPIAGQTSEQFSAEIGRNIGLQAAIRIKVKIYNMVLAASASVADDHEHDVYVDDTTSGNQVDMVATVIQAAKFLMGDHMQTLRVAVCHSKQWNDLALSSISTAFNVPNIMGDVYRDGQFREVLGTRFIIDDQIPTAAGPTTSSPTKHKAIFLRPKSDHEGGLAPIVLSFQRPLEIFDQHVLGAQAVKFQRQPEMAVGYGMRGKQWDTTNGGQNPSDATFNTSTNWDDAYDDHKEVGSVALISN